LTILKYRQEDFANLIDEIPLIKYIDSSSLALILLKKAIVHDNLAVRRYCVKAFLKFNIHLKNFENFIYSTLFEILNASVFYKDVSYEGDSKFYPIVTNYFVGIFNSLKENEYRQNLKKFMMSIEKYTTFCHPLIALFSVFEQLKEKTIDFFGKKELNILDKIIQKNYESLQNRKRIHFFNGIMHLIFNFLDLTQVDFDFFRTLLNILPREIFLFKSNIHTISQLPLLEITKNKDENKLFLNNNFLHREKMFIWLISLPKNLEILSKLYSLGTSLK